MTPILTKIPALKENHSTAFLLENAAQATTSLITKKEQNYLIEKLENENEAIIFKHPELLFFCRKKDKNTSSDQNEKFRKAGAKLGDHLKSEKIKSVQIINHCSTEMLASFLEGLILSGYCFSKYKKEKDFLLDDIFVVDEKVSQDEISEIATLLQAVFYARNLVNEPLSYLTAPQFSLEMEKMSAEAGFTLEVFHKKKIESLKMGGLLAVNKGSIDPPTFNILEWKPENAKNIKPVILVGKGVVFDTGGLSLKPTAKSMDFMKSDMAGGAVVAATIYATAKNKIPVHVIGLVPATDNRPDGNAYVPGDIITMYDGTTVEIKNTDAEGRLLLADALSYAKKYNPELVIDIATLTGAAEIVAGNQAIVAMGNNSHYLSQLKETGYETYERIIEVPLWEEYAKPLKSTVADLNNLGTREAQSTIAGKFLEHFTDYNWIHLDAAGVSFQFEKEGYLPPGGTGFGTRLLYNFLKKFN
ncbi:MAG: leucyl aminopeptidase family protein [Prolixibacteraceae bacterium]|nr:leucyl aminopeptidase family protein [Prolixibacteraceae bacterium]